MEVKLMTKLLSPPFQGMKVAKVLRLFSHMKNACLAKVYMNGINIDLFFQASEKIASCQSLFELVRSYAIDGIEQKVHTLLITSVCEWPADDEI
jgi:hypothetical protein